MGKIFCCVVAFFVAFLQQTQQSNRKISKMTPLWPQKFWSKIENFSKIFFLRFLSLNNVSTQMLYDLIPCGTCLATKNRNLFFSIFRLKSLRKNPDFFDFLQKIAKIEFWITFDFKELWGWFGLQKISTLSILLAQKIFFAIWCVFVAFFATNIAAI